MISADEALERLIEGNRRFVAGEPQQSTDTRALRDNLTEGQEPFAVILGCSDSRVPVEMVFDQSLGDLFVIRVAGNIATPSQIGSIEFAVSEFGTPLVVVLGHTRCGAVKATLQQLQQGGDAPSANLAAIVKRVQPSVEPLLDSELRDNPEELVHAGVRANVRASTEQLRTDSEILETRMHAGQLRVVGAEYQLETGEVEFFEGVSETA